MPDREKLKLFISYSHKDENPYIEDFKKHMIPMKKNGLIEEWCDRNILPGTDFETEINNNLDGSDVICLFISANYLSSSACEYEKQKAMKLNKSRNTLVVPIIIESCGWLDDSDISNILALPEDGKPISSYNNSDEAWYDVYCQLKTLINNELKIKNMSITENIKLFLDNVDMLTNAHPQKQEINLNDIFIYPCVKEYIKSKGTENIINFKNVVEKLPDYSKIVIAGENLSGKTTLCKILFNKYKTMNYIPVYINDKLNQYKGKINNKIEQNLKEQYCKKININKIKDRIVPIIDDFQYASNKEKHINDLINYPHTVLIVDDIFGLNIKEKKLVSTFSYFEINELKPSLRYKLIKKWISLTDKDKKNMYKNIDQKTEMIDSFLGKTIGKGVLSAYPFFVLSAIMTHETYKPLNEAEITSQGYCYQALIYFYLRKQGVKGDKIDTYINFLTELAFYFYKTGKYELSPSEFNTFMEYYLEVFNLPVEEDKLLGNIEQIVNIDSFNNYSFQYPYFYYYFTAKYHAENIDKIEIETSINQIIKNLQVDENAYIAIFLAHHSKKYKILDEILLHALCLFDEYEPATLENKEMGIFEDKVDVIIEASLPSTTTTPENERQELLNLKDKKEERQNNISGQDSYDYKDDIMEIQLRRAVKTVEVMGIIIKNRAGSLEKAKLEQMFKEGMDVHLRILTSFFTVITEEENYFVDFISARLMEVNEDKGNKLNENQLRDISTKLFWNMNFFVIYGVIDKIIHSLGSSNLIDVVKKVCELENTTASFLVKHGVLMWYNKNIQVEEISKFINNDYMSKIPSRVIKIMISNFCRFHPINYKDRQKLENKLGYNTKILLKDRLKETS